MSRTFVESTGVSAYEGCVSLLILVAKLCQCVVYGVAYNTSTFSLLLSLFLQHLMGLEFLQLWFSKYLMGPAIDT